MEGGLARTDPPSPRALPTLASKGIWGGNFSDSQAWTGLETSTLTQGGREVRRLWGPTASPLAHVPITTLVVSTVPLQGAASSGVWERWAMDTTRSLLPPLNSPAATQLPWQPPGPLRRRHWSPCPWAPPPEGSSSAWGLREEGAKERQDSLLSERTFVASQRKEATF